MDLETVSAETFGRSLTGIGVNLLTADVPRLAQFLHEVLGMQVHRQSADYGIALHAGGTLQLHHDATFASHPLHQVLPESGLRGTGVQIYLFGIDPDAVVARAIAAGAHVLETPADKPHGLREATILSPEGYAFTTAADPS